MVHRLTVLYPGQALQVTHVAPSMLPAGMAELICEEPSDEQASLFDVFSDEPLGKSSISSESDVESIIMHAQGFEDFRQRGQSLKGCSAKLSKILSNGRCEKAMATSRAARSCCACSEQR